MICLQRDGRWKVRYHVAFAVVAVLAFVGHLVATFWTEIIWWLPEYIWFVGVLFSILAVYAGLVTATRGGPDARGAAIASAVIGGIVFLGLVYSGTTWLFMPENGYEVFASLG